MGDEFKVIKGGLLTSNKKSIGKQQEIEMTHNLKLFMRGLESNMASVQSQSQKLSNKDLIKAVGEAHLKIVNVLRIIKRDEKSLLDKPDKKKKVLPDYIKLVESKQNVE